MRFDLTQKLALVARLLDPHALRLRRSDCSICGPTTLVKLSNQEIAVRCIGCGASAIHMSIVAVLKQHVLNLGGKRVYELSSRGPVVRFLTSQGFDLTCSEYFDDVRPGEWHDGVQCQDVQRL